jgi:hypothetical protein
MVKHRSGTRWPDDREVRWRWLQSALYIRRREARVSWFGLKTKVDCLLVVWPQKHLDGFPGLSLKIGSYGLMISKSPWWFLGLGIKTMRATICRSRHKTDRRMKTVRGTHRDLAACFSWKQVGLEFPNLALRLVEARRRWCTWYHHGGCIELRLKTAG